ncbi:unnamed protein product [Auanema sp. JU1783]|nr:unnamed protein product [Auanema sp. JU1783]
MSDIAEAYTYIDLFYNATDPARRSESQRWLTQFSSSIHAWTVCDGILHERKSTLFCWVAAQTIRQKILKSLSEIPEESYASLRESLISHIGFFHSATGNVEAESIVMQLCLAIADLYIQVPTWTNWILEFLQRCTNFQGDQTKMMLTLLKVFPEEAHEIRIGENRRKIIQDELAACAPHVITYLTELLTQSPNEDYYKRIYSCLGAYLGNPSMQTDNLAQSPLLQTAFHILATPTVNGVLHDAVTECVVQAIILAEDFQAHITLAHSLQKNVYALAQPFKVAVELEELGKLQNYARIFCELVETMLERIVNEPSNSMEDFGSLYSLELLLLLAEHHDYSIIERTFNVWYRISEALFMIEDDDHLNKYRPFINRYINHLYRHSRFDTDEETVPEEGSDFMEFRAKVSETLKDVVYMVGTDCAVREMCDRLTTCVTKNGTWDEMESALFMISCIIHNLVPDEDSVLPQLICSITGLPPNSHPALFATSVKLVGGSNEWLAKHSNLIDSVVHWLGSLISNPLFAPLCAEAICEISSKCSEYMVPHMQSIASIIPALESQQTHGRKIEKAVCELLKTICAIIPHIRPEEITIRVSEMCRPIMERLLGIINNTHVSTNNENDMHNDSWKRLSVDPVLWLNRIAIIFKDVPPWQKINNTGINVPAPWLQTSQELFEVVSSTLNHYKDRGRVAEYCCRALRYIIRSLGLQSQVFVGRMLDQILEIYASCQHSCLLYLASILVDEYGKIDESRPALIHMLEVLSQSTFNFFMKENDAVNAMKHNPAFIDDFFRLADRYIERCPTNLFISPVVSSIVDCAIVALKVDHDEATVTVSKFICNILRQLNSAKIKNYNDPGVEAAQRIFNEKGCQILTEALNSALFYVSRNLRRTMAEIIFWIGKYDPVAQRRWLESATAQLPRGGLAATDDQLREFVKNITDNADASNSKEVLKYIRELLQLYS